MMLRSLLLCLLLSRAAHPAAAVLYQTDFPPAQFRTRHASVFDRIGNQAVALVPGAPAPDGFQLFRQSNEFYYLCGVETPHSYLLLDGRSRRSALYLPHRDAARERSGDRLLTAEDAEQVKSLTGVDAVHGIEELARHVGSMQIKTPVPMLYVPHSPAEGMASSRDELLHQMALISSDPWDGRPSRQGWFIRLVHDRFPAFEIRDLSPILDELRLIKSEREIAVIRRASRIAALAILEAMRSTRPGVFEYQIDAAAQYTFFVNGARHVGYPSIAAGGKNTFMGHYMRKSDPLRDGDLVLMDFAPDYHYYTSDITRMWPVNGKYTADQRAICEFILAYREALIRRIKPGVTVSQILEGARTEMEKVAGSLTLSKDIYREAVKKALEFRGHLSHPVGMTVHDVGIYSDAPLRPGLVFAVDPMLWVPEEELYMRMEDVVAVTADGVENFTASMPARPADIEKVVAERGIVQVFPPKLQ
jgi:Xaa-Pro aminopeptidase